MVFVVTLITKDIVLISIEPHVRLVKILELYFGSWVIVKRYQSLFLLLLLIKVLVLSLDLIHYLVLDYSINYLYNRITNVCGIFNENV